MKGLINLAGLSVRMKPSGKWEYRFDAGKIGGKRNQVSKAGFATKKEAVIAGTKALAEYNNAGVVMTPSEITCSDFFDKWIDSYCRINLKDTTVIGYEKKIKNHIKPAIGKYKLKSITPMVLQDLIDSEFNNGMSRNSLTCLKAILSGSFDYAVRMKYINSNPMNAVRLPNTRAQASVETHKKSRDALTHEEMQIILDRFPEGHSCHLPLMLAYHCGLRLGEVFGLCEEDFDYGSKTLQINRQIQWDEKTKYWTFVPPKYDSYRTIELDDTISDLLKKTIDKLHEARPQYNELYTTLYQNENKQLVSIGYEKDNLGDSKSLTEMALINRRENGTYIQPRVLQHCYRVIHYELGLANTDFHSIRHTHGTMLLEAGVPMPVIQQRLGHTNIDMTEHYTNHVTESMIDTMKEAINKL